MFQSPLPIPFILARAILACVLLALPACARMVETRTDTIVSREPGRKIEAWHPERDQLDVTVRREGDAMVATVRRTFACTWAVGERRRIATHVEKSANSTDLAWEGVGASLLLVGATLAGNKASPPGDPDNPNNSNGDFGRNLAVIPFVLGAAIGTAFVIDAAAGSEETTERAEIVQTGVQESRECAARPAEGAAVSFAIVQGPALSCRTAADGACSVAVDTPIWAASGGTLVVDVSVDGRLLRHEQLKRGGP